MQDSTTFFFFFKHLGDIRVEKKCRNFLDCDKFLSEERFSEEHMKIRDLSFISENLDKTSFLLLCPHFAFKNVHITLELDQGNASHC